jgi:hypothetical protein
MHQPPCRMNTETPEWHIVAVQRHYEYLDLSNEQAEQIYLFEHESRNTLADALTFSFWEEKDHEWDRFGVILSPEQMVLYERERKAFIEGFESGLRKSDTAEWAVEITIHEEMTGWYADTFIPAFRRDALQSSIALFAEQEKIHYLRAAYKDIPPEKPPGYAGESLPAQPALSAEPSSPGLIAAGAAAALAGICPFLGLGGCAYPGGRRSCVGAI